MGRVYRTEYSSHFAHFTSCRLCHYMLSLSSQFLWYSIMYRENNTKSHTVPQTRNLYQTSHRLCGGCQGGGALLHLHAVNPVDTCSVHNTYLIVQAVHIHIQPDSDHIQESLRIMTSDSDSKFNTYTSCSHVTVLLLLFYV